MSIGKSLSLAAAVRTRKVPVIDQSDRNIHATGFLPFSFFRGPTGCRTQYGTFCFHSFASYYAIAVGGFAILDNHLHVLVRLDPDNAKQWNAGQVVRRWMMIYPPESLDLASEQAVAAWVENEIQDTTRVQTLRQRLQNLSWFMKSLKEPLSRLVDYTSRLFHAGKANLNTGVKEIFDRLESNVEVWNDRIRQMLSCRELRGTFFAANQQKLREHSSHCGKRRAKLRPQLSVAPVS